MACAAGDDPDCLPWDGKPTPTGHSGSLDEETERTLPSFRFFHCHQRLSTFIDCIGWCLEVNLFAFNEQNNFALQEQAREKEGADIISLFPTLIQIKGSK